MKPLGILGSWSPVTALQRGHGEPARPQPQARGPAQGRYRCRTHTQPSPAQSEQASISTDFMFIRAPFGGSDAELHTFKILRSVSERPQQLSDRVKVLATVPRHPRVRNISEKKSPSPSETSQVHRLKSIRHARRLDRWFGGLQAVRSLICRSAKSANRQAGRRNARTQPFELRIDKLRKLLLKIRRRYGNHAVFEPERNDSMGG